MTPARIVGLASALVLVGFAVAIGAIPDSDDGEVHFCFNKKRPAKGAVRVINHEAGRRCRSRERELVLDQRGLTGPQGPGGAVRGGSAGLEGPGGADGAGGADGPTGVAGASGLSRTFFASASAIPLPSAGAQVSESVPGGTYLVSAVADIENDDIEIGDTVSCSLDLTSAGPGDQQLAQSIGYALAQATLPLDAVKISLESTASVSLVFEPETISLTCTPGVGDTATLRRASLTLIRFASIG